MAAKGTADVTLEDAWEYVISAVLLAWSKTTKRVRAASGILMFSLISFAVFGPSMPEGRSLPKMPKVSLRYGPQLSSYNASKVAFLVENRPNPVLAPLILHFMSVVPPDWRFKFMGSLESVDHVNSSRAIRQHVESGKLDLTYIPANMTTGSQEEISRFLTTLWLYEVVLQPAEWLLVYQTDSMLCANSRQSLNNFLDYDWVGAPWHPDSRFGGNGGLSLRRVSAIIDVLRYQVREHNTEPEDVWLTDRLGNRPGARLANGTASLTFSGEGISGEVERVTKGKHKGKTKPEYDEYTKAGDLIKGIDDWRDGFYEPMGYHTGGGGSNLHGGIFGRPELREHLWNYCPEIKMMLRMDAAKYVPGSCNKNWKRWDDGEMVADDRFEQDEIEIINDREYPLLPAGVTPW